MSLAEVAARVRERQAHAEQANPTVFASLQSIGVLLEAIVREFEDDPDFTLRERVEKLADALDLARVFPDGEQIEGTKLARRLRELLNPTVSSPNRNEVGG